jgi:hypothetical protein
VLNQLSSTPWRHMRSEGKALPSLTLALDEGEWSASCSCRFTPRERAPGSHWIGGWMSLRIGLNGVGNRKSCTIINHMVEVQPLAHCYTDWA